MSFHAGQTFVFGEQPSATKMQYIWDNDYALADGSGLSANAIINRHWLDETISFAKLSGKAWEELGRKVLSGVSDSIIVNLSSARRRLKVLWHCLPDSGSSIDINMRFNADFATNYARRSSTNGAADSTSGSTAGLSINPDTGAFYKYGWAEVTNVDGQEKYVNAITMSNNGNGAGNAPARREFAGKWATTSGQITRVDIVNVSTGDFAAGSSVVVLGRD